MLNPSTPSTDEEHTWACIVFDHPEKGRYVWSKGELKPEAPGVSPMVFSTKASARRYIRQRVLKTLKRDQEFGPHVSGW